jgi:hypothetical protein
MNFAEKNFSLHPSKVFSKKVHPQVGTRQKRVVNDLVKNLASGLLAANFASVSEL